MVPFNLWREALIFGLVYSVIIIVPCVVIAIMGTRLINELGRYPSKTPAIQMSVLIPLIITEIVTFAFLLMVCKLRDF